MLITPLNEPYIREIIEFSTVYAYLGSQLEIFCLRSDSVSFILKKVEAGKIN